MTRLFVEQLTVIDCAYLDARRGLVGESWIVDVELEGALDAQSMVLDFGDVKRQLKRAIDASADHTLLVPARSPALKVSPMVGGLALEFESAVGTLRHASPITAVTLIDAGAVDADTLTAYLHPLLLAEVPASVTGVQLRLRNEAIDGAYYHYTHGLKKHRGACQRIAHGHRSRLEIRVDGRRQPQLEAVCSERWQDIYLGTREDAVDARGGALRFEYRAEDGDFLLELPARRCHLMDADTTVECIAEHLLASLTPSLRAAHAEARIEVRAFEGVMKGAIASSADA